MTYHMTKDWQIPFEELFQEWKGNIKTEQDTVTFKAINELRDYWGKIHKVECDIKVTISFIVDPKRYSVWAEEKTCEIIGGSASGSLTKDEALNRVKKELVRYNFQQRKNMQIALF